MMVRFWFVSRCCFQINSLMVASCNISETHKVVLELPWPTLQDRQEVEDLLSRRAQVKSTMYMTMAFMVVIVGMFGGVFCLTASQLASAMIFQRIMVVWGILMAISLLVSICYYGYFSQLDQQVQWRIIRTFQFGYRGNQENELLATMPSVVFP